jgi:TPR repeat protein
MLELSGERNLRYLLFFSVLLVYVHSSYAEVSVATPSEVSRLNHAASKGDAEALDSLKAEAERGNEEAQLDIAMMYGNGRGVKKDEVAEAKWLRMAAERGSITAQRLLALLCEHGAQPNYVEAAKWYRKLSDQGDPASQGRLAHLYENGQGVTKDLVQAYAWYSLATGAAPKVLDHIAQEMTSVQLTEAKRLVNELRPAHSSFETIP